MLSRLTLGLQTVMVYPVPEAVCLSLVTLKRVWLDRRRIANALPSGMFLLKCTCSSSLAIALQTCDRAIALVGSLQAVGVTGVVCPLMESA